jgi:hypothetical protein
MGFHSKLPRCPVAPLEYRDDLSYVSACRYVDDPERDQRNYFSTCYR